MRYAKIMPNDIVDGEGICVSFWTQGCPHRCVGCHNPETWDFNGGIEEEPSILINKILTLLRKNNVKRNLSILGREPLCPQNIDFIFELCQQVKEKYPDTKIFLWTGYYKEKLKQEIQNKIEKYIDILIDGPFILEQRDLTLKLRGSRNQRILTKKDF